MNVKKVAACALGTVNVFLVQSLSQEVKDKVAEGGDQA